jgi:hypothetical protein
MQEFYSLSHHSYFLFLKRRGLPIFLIYFPGSRYVLAGVDLLPLLLEQLGPQAPAAIPSSETTLFSLGNGGSHL